MAVNRRDFVKASAAASIPLIVNNTPVKAANQIGAFFNVDTPASFNLPIEYVALNKIAYGPTLKDIERFKSKGLSKYLEEQLNPDESKENPIIAEKLSKLKFKVKVKDRKERTTAVQEMGVTFLNKTPEELWAYRQEYFKGNNGQILNQPAVEVAASTWIKAVYSKYQLKEVMAEFWHNHFNVDAFSDKRISIFFVEYDRDVIRKHCFGNFREFLEATAKSPSMLYYLNNNSSKASPANENYARELFELHTLGEDNYFNELYDKWRDVPGAEEGKAIGYIDEDVYEAARAFTGWTVGDGASTGRKRERAPSTGKFHYQDSWHDHYQKRIMGVEFSSNQGPMEDAIQVLDLVAYHRGTAEFICKKLCMRLVSDNPPKSLLSKAVNTWMKNQKEPDQIAKVLKTIILSPEFKAEAGKKVKRPFELVLSYIRSTGMDFTPSKKLHGILMDMGYQLFRWPAPTGHPDESEYWTGTGMMLKRWKTTEFLSSPYNGKISVFNDLDKSIKENGQSASQFVSYWYNRLIGTKPNEQTHKGLLAILGKGDKPDDPITSKDNFRARRTVSSIAMLHEFQVR